MEDLDLTDLEPFGSLSLERTLEVIRTPIEVLAPLMAVSQTRELTTEEKDATQLAIDRLLIQTLQQMGLTYQEAVDAITSDEIEGFEVGYANGNLTISVQYKDGGS